jgi:alkylation response protein AidB-like acyl-CoA dehydrogenase
MNAAAQAEATVDEDVSAMLRQSVRDFCRRHPGVARTRIRRDTEPGYDRAVWTAMAEAGWAGMALPDENGGLGLGLREICIVAEELAADLAPEPFGPATVAALAIARGDNNGLRNRLLPGIAAGTILPAFAWQERPNTLDVAQVETRLTATANGGLALTGRKRFVPAASGAAGLAVTASTVDGTAIVWLPADAAGLSIEPSLCVDGSWLHTLHFDAAPVSRDDIIATPRAAAPLLARLIDEAAVIGTAELLGIIRAAFERTHAYVGQRSQFGKLIGSFQALQHRLVDVWMQRELVSALLDEAIAACSAGDADARARAASAAKAKASAAALATGRQSIQFHGAIGYADEHDIGLYLKRAIVKSAWMGSAPVHRRRLARLFRYETGE